jgi:hypothetical protein
MWTESNYDDLLKIPPSKKPCFLAGTPIKTATGYKNIEDIVVGDVVLSYNETTKKTELQEVLNTFTNVCEKYIEIKTNQDIIAVTGAHLFFVPKENKWIAASQLTTNMQLINDKQEEVNITALTIIKKEANTYNLEIAQNHNYYVGNNPILTHNDAKILKYSSEILLEFEFYEFLDYDNKSLYVGQTTQGITKRADQHTRDYIKTPNKKEFMNPEINGGLKRIRINNNPKLIKVKMTPFEAALTEMYELQLRGGKRRGLLGLFNKKNPVSKRTFIKIKKDFPSFNPCRFYV